MKKTKQTVAILLLIVLLCIALCSCTKSPYKVIYQSIQKNGVEGTLSSGKYWTVYDYKTDCNLRCFDGYYTICGCYSTDSLTVYLYLYEDDSVEWTMNYVLSGSTCHMEGTILKSLATSDGVDSAFVEYSSKRTGTKTSTYAEILKGVAKSACSLLLTEFDLYCSTYTNLNMTDFNFINWDN